MKRTHEELKIDACFDRHLINESGKSVRYLVVNLKAPVPDEEPAERQPLNLGVVIDASGSMRGDRIEAAKQAAAGIVEVLTERDCLSVVSFDSNATTLLESVKLDAAGRAKAKNIIESIRTGSMTNLSQGYVDGAECVARELERSPRARSRILLLSDGRANKGTRDPDSLADIASNLRERGLFTSTVGIGDDYSTEQLQVLAEHGGGLMHDAETPEEIIEVVAGELGELGETYADDISMHLAHTGVLNVDVLGDFPLSRDPEGTKCKLGPLVSGRSRTVVFRIKTPPGKHSSTIDIALEAHIRKQGDEELLAIDAGTFRLEFADVASCRTQPRDEKRSLTVATIWQAYIVKRALRLNHKRRYRAALEYVEKVAVYFTRYCKGISGAEEFSKELKLFARKLARPMHERMRKNIDQDLYSLGKGKMDHRRYQRPGWKQALSNVPLESWGAPEHYPLVSINGYPVLEVDGYRVLLDTGSPVSIGEIRLLRLGGRTHRLNSSYLGMSVSEICRETNTDADVLLGNDILQHYYVRIDPQRREVVISPTPLHTGGQRVPFSFDQGVPLITANVDAGPVSMFVDTSATLSYLDPRHTSSHTAGEEVQDFYPGVGTFTTPTYSVDTSVAGNVLELTYGCLPPMIGNMLSVAGADGLLGSEFCGHYVMEIAFPQREIWLREVQPGERREQSACLCCVRGVHARLPRQCPICHHVFQGNGWDGIDAHWRARHLDVMSYEDFWESLCQDHRAPGVARIA